MSKQLPLGMSAIHLLLLSGQEQTRKIWFNNAWSCSITSTSKRSSCIVSRRKKAEDEKLQAVLQYTRDTFKRLEFEEAEVYQICESVRYFVTNRQVLTQTDVRIKRKANVTQIDLKNFAWNIAFQYNIGGDITAQFVMQTFNEWFANSTLDTIRKNLRTTTGRRKIEISEKLP